MRQVLISVATMVFVNVGPRGAKHFRIVYLSNWTPVKMDTILAGRDVVATATEIAHIRMAHGKGLVNIVDNDVLGCSIEEIASVFSA